MLRLTICLPVTLALLACGSTAPGSSQGAATPARLSVGPSLSAPRATHALVRASGGLIVAIGGCVADGCESGAESATADVFSADGTRIVRTSALLHRRIQPGAAALPDGRVLIVGGWVDGRVAASTEIFDPVSGRSIAGPQMAGPRSSATLATLADGRVLVAGGYDGRLARADAEIFDPATGAFSPTAPLVTARTGATGSLLADGRVLIAGGGDGESADRRVVAGAELFDPASRRFAPTGQLGVPRYKHGAVTLPTGDVLILGGSDVRDYGGKLTSVERYDAASGRFSPFGTLSVPRFKLADGVLLLDSGNVLIAAGDDQPEIFDIAARRGTPIAASLGGQWNYMTAIRLDGRSAFLAGGYREGRIEPTDRTWRLSL